MKLLVLSRLLCILLLCFSIFSVEGRAVPRHPNMPVPEQGVQGLGRSESENGGQGPSRQSWAGPGKTGSHSWICSTSVHSGSTKEWPWNLDLTISTAPAPPNPHTSYVKGMCLPCKHATSWQDWLLHLNPTQLEILEPLPHIVSCLQYGKICVEWMNTFLVRLSESEHPSKQLQQMRWVVCGGGEGGRVCMSLERGRCSPASLWIWIFRAPAFLLSFG